jgi:NDP-4-keto-2,6-dideoxyhexose 3-C-methyltransferase
MPTPITQCRICGNTDLELILQLGDQKLTGVFPATADEEVLSGPLDLVRCVPSDTACGLLQLRHSYPLDAMYGDNYGYRSGLNRSMSRHLEEKSAGLVKLSGARAGDLVVDIGCNDGTLLKSHPAHFERIGIDPVAEKFIDFYPPEIQVIPEFFTPDLWRTRFEGRQARIITSIAMFYDIESPLEFMQTIHGALAPKGVWHFEQSYMPLMLEHCAYDTICHEHIEYYALRQIQWMAQRCGLKIIGLETSSINGGSLAVTAARADSPHPEATADLARLTAAETAAGFESMQPFYDFRKRVFQHRAALQKEIKSCLAGGKTLGGYGASTKGNVLLQFCGLTPREIPFIAEVNTEKFGHFTPGTGIPIISEEEMHARAPDVLLVLPWHFRENIIAREANFLARGGRLLFPLPHPEYHPQ